MEVAQPMPDKQHDQQPEYIPPDSAIESLARCLLPAIQEYFESERGKREFEEWKRKKEEAK
jgi:hypothetical protein